MDIETETKQPTGGAAGGGATEAKGEQTPAERTFTQAEVDRINRREKKAREDAEAELAKLRDAQKTEQEKLIDAARNEERTRLTAEMTQKELTAETRLELVKRGLDPDLTKFLEIGDKAEIGGAIDALLNAKPYLKPQAAPKAPGQNGNPNGGPSPTDSSRPWSLTKIRASIKEHGHVEHQRKFGREIDEDRRKGVYVNA